MHVKSLTQTPTQDKHSSFIKRAIFIVLLLIFPFIAMQFGNSWVRIIDVALLYVLLALGLNIVVGFAGLLDLGYIAFFAIGAYLAGLFASPQFAVVIESLLMEYPAAGAALSSLVGSDVVANNLSVPEMEVGDWIIIGGMGKIFYLGAYTVGPASEFNGMKALSKVVIWE